MRMLLGHLRVFDSNNPLQRTGMQRASERHGRFPRLDATSKCRGRQPFFRQHSRMLGFRPRLGFLPPAYDRTQLQGPAAAGLPHRWSNE